MKAAKTKGTHGGRREGAGRKPSGRVTVGYNVAPETAAWLRAQKQPGRAIDALVRKAMKRRVAQKGSSAA